MAKIDSALFQWIDSAEIARIYEDLSNESDRNAVIVATSIIDDILSSKVKSLLKAGTDKEQNALFSDNGPFSSMYCKIEWLYCIGELNEHTRKDVNLIRKMRNDAAHIWRSFNLESDKNVKTMEKMHSYQTVASIKESIAQENSVSTEDVQMDPRVCFNLMTSLIIVLLGDKKSQ